ncbi:DUF4340 domain-containing protein [Alteromonas lipolytica]|uniref:DUF4340 domain-containing protein n=1 Tax=Alteromonas lipolytica TaxID=1856405 RepID=A0A1E8F9H0_9ALTE|nr:DUF4340 domain-containing protein [Alteromonas lipolytica]OFI32550.1 hypothetical protein BFC17_05185 [Alteromonas lipolytica]GGF75192.1 hypothetical protein GCM10011338_29100 [Alteromonas lipolytica]
MIRVAVLFLLVVITLGSAYYLVVQRHPQQVAQSHLLLGGLAAESQSLSKITIENAQGTLFAARKDSEQWLATHLDSVMRFPVDVEKLSAFVSALTQARIIEPKTAKASQYPLLGVEPVTQPDSQSTLITLASPTKQWRVLIGNLASSGLGRYVREPSQQQSYLINEAVSLPLTPNEWLMPDVIDAGLNTLQSVTIDSDPAFTLFREADGNWQLSENKLPLAYPGVLVHTLNDIVNFEYETVSPLIEQPSPDRLVRTIDISASDDKSLRLSIYNRPREEGYILILSGDLIDASMLEWQYGLTDFQARGLLSSKGDLLQQPQTPPGR